LLGGGRRGRGALLACLGRRSRGRLFRGGRILRRLLGGFGLGLALRGRDLGRGRPGGEADGGSEEERANHAGILGKEGRFLHGQQGRASNTRSSAGQGRG